MERVIEEKLYLENWNSSCKEYKINVITDIINERKLPFSIKKVEEFSANNMSVETVILEYEDSEFVFIPGCLEVTLGWDSNTCKMGENLIKDLEEDFKEEIEYYKETYEEMKEDYEEQIKEAKAKNDVDAAKELIEEMNEELENYEMDQTFEERLNELSEYIDISTSPVRKTSIKPMIVERDLHSVRKYNTYKEFREELKNTIFTIPTEDEYEYICGGGKRTLYRWGDSLKEELSAIYSIGTINENNDILYSPNMFELHILYDSYMYELVDDECFYKGGDGGCTLCGGDGTRGVVPVYSTFYVPTISENISWDIEKGYCYYRRIINNIV